MFGSFMFPRFEPLHVSKFGFAPIFIKEKFVTVLRRSRHEYLVQKGSCVIYCKLGYTQPPIQGSRTQLLGTGGSGSVSVPPKYHFGCFCYHLEASYLVLLPSSLGKLRIITQIIINHNF